MRIKRLRTLRVGLGLGAKTGWVSFAREWDQTMYVSWFPRQLGGAARHEANRAPPPLCITAVQQRPRDFKRRDSRWFLRFIQSLG